MTKYRWIDNLKKIKRKLYRKRKNLKLAITGVETPEKVIALTFDDGPHPVYTPLILDLLEQYQAKATFFVVGEAARENRFLIKKMREQGHAIGNHSWNHLAMPLISRKERLKQIRDTQSEINAKRKKLFRPPWGFLTLSSYIDVKLLGYKIVLWDTVAFDWLDRSSDKLFKQLDSNIKPGSIILMHDNLKPTFKPRDELIKALEKYLKKYAETYKFVTLPQLLTIGDPRYKYCLSREEDKFTLIPKHNLKKAGGYE